MAKENHKSGSGESRYQQAMQRHHDFYTHLVLTSDIVHPGDIANVQLATDRELRGEVKPLVDANGIKIVIIP